MTMRTMGMRSKGHFTFYLLTILFTILHASESAFGEDENRQKGKLFNLALGIRGATDINFRGATFYDSWQITPVLYASLFEHRVQFLGDSLEYVDFIWNRRLRGRTKVYMISDEPLYTTGEDEGFRNSRKTTYEWLSTLEFFYPSHDNFWAEVDLKYGYDFAAHNGHYGELTAKGLLGKYVKHHDTYWIQPEVYATLGVGSSAHNKFYYGPEADSAGLNYVQYGLQFLLLPRVDSAYPVIQFNRYEVVGGKNRSGSLVRDKVSGFQVVGYFVFGIF